METTTSPALKFKVALGDLALALPYFGGSTPQMRYENLRGVFLEALMDYTHRLAEGKISAYHFERGWQSLIREAFVLAYEYGKEHIQSVQLGLTPEDLAAVRAQIDREKGFLRRFVEQIKAKTGGAYAKKPLPELAEHLEYRTSLYAEALRTLWFQGQVSQVGPLTQIYWNLFPPAHHCPDCIRIAAGNPYTPKTLPTLPGHDVQCMRNCKCFLTFGRPATPEELQIGQWSGGHLLRHVTLQTLREVRMGVVVALYDPNQPRIPKGQPGGGQWTSYKTVGRLRWGANTIQPDWSKAGREAGGWGSADRYYLSVDGRAKRIGFSFYDIEGEYDDPHYRASRIQVEIRYNAQRQKYILQATRVLDKWDDRGMPMSQHTPLYTDDGIEADSPQELLTILKRDLNVEFQGEWKPPFIHDQGVVTGDDPELIQQAIENHAEADSYPVRVSSVRRVEVQHELAGEGEVWEGWHGTDTNVGFLMLQGERLKPSKSGAFCPGVYIAPGANKSLAYGRDGRGVNAMVRVKVRPGRVLDYTKETKQEVEKALFAFWDTETLKIHVRRAQMFVQKLGVAGQVRIEPRRGKKPGTIIPKAGAELPLRVQRLLEVWNWSIGNRDKLAIYALSEGYDTVRYTPPRTRDPFAYIAASSKLNFKNEEWLIFDSGRVVPIAVAFTKSGERA